MCVPLPQGGCSVSGFSASTSTSSTHQSEACYTPNTEKQLVSVLADFFKQLIGVYRSGSLIAAIV